MKVVMAQAPETLLAKRRKSGADQWDEMWKGVLHMPPAPNRSHQDVEGALEMWLRQFWVPASHGKVYHQINVASIGGWPDDYRIPDVVLLTPDRFHIDRNEYFEGGPTVVVEIRSNDDETYEKFDFYAGIRVDEIWVIDRDSRQPQLHRLTGSGYQQQEPDNSGWISSSTGAELSVDRQEDLLLIRLKKDELTQQSLP